MGYLIVFDDCYGDCEFDRQFIEVGMGLNCLFLYAAVLKFIYLGIGEVMCIEVLMDEGLKCCL